MSIAGLCHTHGGTEVMVPLKSASYLIKFAGVCGEIAIRQTFVNETRSSIEAVYLFPKHEGAVITQFSFETGDRRFRTFVEEKDRAFKYYDEAMKKGDGAVLLDEVTRDLVQISVGNLLPGQEIIFSIKWAQELQIIDGKYRLIVPLTRFPRYQRIGADPVLADVQNDGVAEKVPYPMDLTVLWENALVSRVTSTTHSEWEQPENDKGAPFFSKKGLKNGITAFTHDLELIGEPAGSVENTAIIARNDNGSTILFSRFIHHLDDWSVPAGKEVVFLLDCSGSMEGTPMENAKKALELCIRSLSDTDTFSFVLFGSDFKLVRDKENRPFKYTDSNFSHALSLINTFNATMGGTELYNVAGELLRNAFNGEKMQEWILLTDGAVSDPEQLIQLVADAKAKPRIFTFGIGHGASTSLLRGLARVSGGSCEMILDESVIAEVVLRQFARIDQPRFENIRLDTGEAGNDLAEPFESIFEGDSWHVFSRLKDPDRIPTTVILNATANGRQIVSEAPIIDLGTWNTPGCLWAAKKVRFLEDNLPICASNQTARMTKTLRNEALHIALEFGIMSNQTSFIGIEERKEEDKWVERPVYTVIPSLMAADRVAEAVRPWALPRTPEIRFQREEAPEHSKRKPRVAEQSWYLKLMDAMNRDGRFGYDKTMKILSEIFSNIPELIQKLSAERRLSSDRASLATLIAIKALESNEKAKKVCAKAIKKARSALVSAGVDINLLDGIVIEENKPGMVK